MQTYHKIQTVYQREPKTKKLIRNKFSLPCFEYLFRNVWDFTEKVDGTNIRVSLAGDKRDRLHIGGRTADAQIPAKLIQCLYEKFDVGKLQEKFDGDFCLYGEGYGAKIQKGGGNYRSDQSFTLFDVRVGDWWLQREDIEDVAAALGIEVVPIVATGTLETMIEMCEAGFDSRWGDFMAEGLIGKPAVEMFARNGDRIITKLKCKDFDRKG